MSTRGSSLCFYWFGCNYERRIQTIKIESEMRRMHRTEKRKGSQFGIQNRRRCFGTQLQLTSKCACTEWRVYWWPPYLGHVLRVAVMSWWKYYEFVTNSKNCQSLGSILSRCRSRRCRCCWVVGSDPIWCTTKHTVSACNSHVTHSSKRTTLPSVCFSTRAAQCPSPNTVQNEVKLLFVPMKATIDTRNRNSLWMFAVL